MISDRVDFLRGLLAPLPAQLEHDSSGEAPAIWPEFGAVCAAYVGGRCDRDVVLRVAACRLLRELPADIGELVHSSE